MIKTAPQKAHAENQGSLNRATQLIEICRILFSQVVHCFWIKLRADGRLKTVQITNHSLWCMSCGQGCTGPSICCNKAWGEAKCLFQQFEIHITASDSGDRIMAVDDGIHEGPVWFCIQGHGLPDQTFATK